MSIPKKTIRGVQSIRTISGRSDPVSEPYKAFLRIGALEMEKARRGKERQSAMDRVRNIEARFRQIEDEKAALMNSLGDALGQRSTGNAVDAPGNEPKPAPHRSTGGFRVRY